MNSETTFSIIIPVYKTELKLLKRCVDSILANDFDVEKYEIILVDDNNRSDGSGRLCARYSSKYDQITVLHQKNTGVGAARNTGLKMAKGRWICFVDADDWVEKNMLKIMDDTIQDSVSNIIIFNAYVHKNNTLIDNKILPFESFELKGNDREELQLQMLSSKISKFKYTYIGPNSPWGKLYNHRFLKENNLWFNEKLPKGQDLIFNLYAFEASKSIKYVDKTIYNYFLNDQSITFKYNTKIIEIYEKLLQSINEFIIKYNKNERFSEALNIATLNGLQTYFRVFYFHKKNKNLYRRNKTKIFNLIKKKPYNDALNKIKLCQLSNKEKFLFIFLKLQFIEPIYLFYNYKRKKSSI